MSSLQQILEKQKERLQRLVYFVDMRSFLELRRIYIEEKFLLSTIQTQNLPQFHVLLNEISILLHKMDILVSKSYESDEDSLTSTLAIDDSYDEEK